MDFKTLMGMTPRAFAPARYALALGAFALATPIAASAQTSSSQAQVFNVTTLQAPCNLNSYSTPGSSSTSCGPLTTGSVTGSSSASSTNVGATERQISAMSQLKQTGAGGTEVTAGASAQQASSLSNAGIYTPGSTLVFHFSVPTVTDGFTGSTSISSYWDWNLQVQSSQDGNAATATQQGNGNGTTTPVNLHQGDGITTGSQASTSGGVDLWVPFGWYGSYTNDVFTFQTSVNVFTQLYDTQIGAGDNIDFSAILTGIDARDAQGQVYASGVFDPNAGTWALETTNVTTTPEPGSLALLGTGLFGLVPMLRRKRNS